MEPGLPTLHSNRLVLRPFTPADAPEVQRLAGSPEVSSTTLNIPDPYEDGMAEAWIARHGPEFAADAMVVLAITVDTVLVGAISLRLERAHRRAELGYWIGRPYWGQGYATEAANTILEYGFSTLALNRIQATHLTRNPASGRVMQKVGMRLEGIQREHFWKNGRPETIARYAILAADRAALG
jgi:[ribosomal protein S5]-alanine N-acetyltransferase